MNSQKSRGETKVRPQRETKLQMVVKWEYFEDFVRVENSYDYRLLQKNSREVVVGATGFTTINYHTTICKLLFCNNIEL